MNINLFIVFLFCKFMNRPRIDNYVINVYPMGGGRCFDIPNSSSCNVNVEVYRIIDGCQNPTVKHLVKVGNFPVKNINVEMKVEDFFKKIQEGLEEIARQDVDSIINLY